MTALDVDADTVARTEAILADLPTEAHRREVRAMVEARAAQAEIDANRGRWVHDPVAWADERLGVQLWSKQCEIVESVRDRKRTAVRSCNDVGKSFSAALLIAWWIDVHPPGSAFVVSSAPTFAQVRAILWRELRGLHRRGNLDGKVNNTEWIDQHGDIVGYGRKPADHDAVGFLGIHARYVLVVLDEAGGVPKSLWDATESIATNADSRILAIGNPDDPSTEFGVVAHQPALWATLQISAFDAPNLTGEKVSDAVRHNTVDASWVEDAALRWGTTSPLYISRVLGEFPVDASDRAVRFADVISKTINVDPPYDGIATLLSMTPVVLGLDIGGGSDYTVARERRGNVAYRSWSALTKEPAQVAEMVLRAILVTGATQVNYDATGIGWGIGEAIAAALREAKMPPVSLNPVQFGAASNEPAKYLNKRAELVFGIGRLFSQDGAWYLGGMVDGDTGDPNWEDTIAQLVDQKWSLGAGGRIVIEKKEDIIKRTGRSPDDSDALLLAFADGDPVPVVIQRPEGSLPVGAGPLTTRSTKRPAALPVRAGLRNR